MEQTYYGMGAEKKATEEAYYFGICKITKESAAARRNQLLRKYN